MKYASVIMMQLGAASIMAHATFAGEDPSAPAVETHCVGQEENLAVYLEMSRVLFNERQVERVDEFYTPGFISHNVDEGGIGIREVRLVDMQEMWLRIEEIEPDREVINNLIICEDNLVVAQVTTQGTHIGKGLEGDPEGGRRYRTSAIDIYRMEDGKVVERWGNNDMVAKSRQLGKPLDLSLQPLQSDGHGSD